MGGVFEGDLAFGDGVVGGRLHQSVDKDRRGALAIDGFSEGDFACEVDAVDGEDGRGGESNLFLGGHDLAAGEGQTDHGLGGGACTGGVGGVDTCDREGCFGDLDGGAFFGDGRYILACFCTSTSDGLESAAYGAADGFGNTCVGGGCCGQGVGQGRPVVFGVGRNNAVDLFYFEFLHNSLIFGLQRCCNILNNSLI